MTLGKPKPEPIITEDLCAYGCGQNAKYKFSKGKLCCSKHYNSCPGKRKRFSEEQDHKANARKSLATRTKLGITKTSQIKAGKTRRECGHYDKLSTRMKDLWKENPWNNHATTKKFLDTELHVQSSYEEDFLNGLVERHGLKYVADNVKRGPTFTYKHPITGEEKIYVSDFIIGNTVYEIKSSYTWKGLGRETEAINEAKLNSAKSSGHTVILILDKKEIII